MAARAKSGLETEPVAASGEPPTFEVILARLEGIASTLEAGEAPLDESLKLYEEGVALARLGNERLAAAERRILELTADDGTRPFQGGTTGEPDSGA